MADIKRKVPNLRFKGFTDYWEQRKLSTLVTLHARIGWQNLRTSEFLDSGNYMLITGTDFNNGKIDYSKVHYVEKNRYDQDPKLQLHNGNILITKDGTIGKVAYVDRLKMPATLNAGVFNVTIKNKDETNNKYLFNYLNAPFLMKYATAESTGGTIKHLNQKVLVNFPVPISSIKEQNKISNLLEIINKLLSLQQRKLELLKQLKKGFLQKMFADKDSKRPILRFEGFTGNWEIRQLKELGEIITGNTPKTSQVENYSSNGIPWVTPTDINSVYTTDSAKRLSTVGKDKAKIAPANSLLVTCIASIGKNTLILQESAFNQQINALIPVKNDPFFLLAESAKWSRIMRNLAGQTSMQIINKKTFSGISTSIPDLKEQKIIGSLFKKLDNTIAFQQQRISRVNEIKKSLLQQMFI